VLAVVNKALRWIPALGAVFFAVVGLAACGSSSSVPSNAVAKVDETAISNAAFKHWLGIAVYSTAQRTSAINPVIPQPPLYTACIAQLKQAYEAEQKTPEGKSRKIPNEAELKKQCEMSYENFKNEVMSFLVSSQWVLSEAKARGINLSDAEVRKQFLKIKAQQFTKPGEFEKFLAASHQSVSDLLLRVKLNELSTKIQAQVAKKKHTVSDSEVEKYYNTNASRFGTPEKRNVNVILTKTEGAANAAKKEVQSGKSFATVAKSVSTDPTSKTNGGLLTEVVKGQEAAPLDKAVFSASKGVLSGPVKTAFGYYVYEVKSVTPATRQPLSSVKQNIKQQLTVTQNQEALSKFVKEFKKRWLAKTHCASGYNVPDCNGYKAPKKAGSSTAVEGAASPEG
jgi:foldase protein PrsA